MLNRSAEVYTQRSQHERFFPRPELDISSMLADLLQKGETSISLESNPPCSCTFTLEKPDKGAIEKTLLLNLCFNDGTNKISGMVGTHFDDDSSQDRTKGLTGNVRKRWYTSDRSAVEGRGLMQLGTALVMILAYKNFNVTQFDDWASGEVPDELVVKSRPNGVFGEFQITTIAQESELNVASITKITIIKTTVSKIASGS